MVVKTEVCNFSKNKIYPGKGIRIITRDGKLVILGSKKAKAFYKSKKKAQKIRWTIVWRRMNKKLTKTKTSKKRRRKAGKIIKEISGLNKDEIDRRQNITQEEREAVREKAIREIKEKKKMALKGKRQRKK